MEEALLIAKIHGFAIDYQKAIGSSYKQTKNGYECHLARFHRCPVSTEVFKVSIDTFGNYKAESLGFYYAVDNDICAD